MPLQQRHHAFCVVHRQSDAVELETGRASTEQMKYEKRAEKCVTVSVTQHNHEGDEIKEDKMYGTCSTHELDE